ncbi:UNVERIFIED_CONTAM: hypothetical protein Sangu_3224100 [Sesamum angustifolium]|uniref:Uncharacterized protein n=1 Tax=Sesamum angustifolium TaxID=2727405 RepID=A0AAW2JI38_9LAMI
MDEGEDGELVDGNHGAASAAPAAVPTAGGGAMMGYETEHGEHGAVSACPAINTSASVTEFFHLASRVLDNGDAEFVAALLELKRRWFAKFGEDDSIGGGHGGFRSVHNRPSTPFAGPLITRHARRCPRVPTAKKRRSTSKIRRMQLGLCVLSRRQASWEMHCLWRLRLS